MAEADSNVDTEPDTTLDSSGRCEQLLEIPDRNNGDEETCMSSVTGFDFEFYPDSGLIYPALESVPSAVPNNAAADMDRANDKRPQPLPVLLEDAPSANPNSCEIKDLEAAVLRKTNTDIIAHTQADASVNPSTCSLARLNNGRAKSSVHPNAKLMKEGSGVGPAMIPILGLEEAIEQGIQPFPSPSCTNDIDSPGAFQVEGSYASNGGSSNNLVEEGEIQEEEEEEVQVHEAHLVVADDNPESAGVTHTQEVLEGKAIKSREEEDNRQGKPIVWFLMATCFLVALALLLVFLLGPSSDKQAKDGQLDTTEIAISAAPTAIETAASTPTIWYPPFLEDTPAEVIIGIENREDSPFYKANLWIWNDPNMDSYSPERLKQRFYLVMMYYATNGDGWLRKDNWLSYDLSECDWFSQSTFPPDSKYYEPDVCQDINGTSTVINLSLASNNLTGSWPIYYYAFMPRLKIFDLGNNHIGGALPVMTATSYIEVSIISNNPLQGKVKLNGGAFFDNIKVIRSDGTLTHGNNGGASYQILNKGLEVHNATGQPNDGQIWTELGTLTSLEYYGQGHTNITGTIPTEMGLLTSLKEADLSSLPNLFGTIPSELGLLTNLALLDLAETPLSGTVPAELCSRVQAGLLVMPANCSSLRCC